MAVCTFEQAQTVVPSLTADLWNDVVNDAREEQLAKWLTAYGIDTSECQRCAMLESLALMLGQNQVLNLTAIRDVDKAMVLHLVDSALFVPSVAGYPGPVMDLGTGGGFPGLPLAILCPDDRFLLVDSVKKKVSAVAKFVEVLGLSDRVCVSSERAEVLGSTKRGKFGVVVARAVAPTNVLLEYASPLLKPFGSLVASKAELTEDEEEDASGAARQVGMELVSRETLELPDGFGHREILVYEKADKAHVKLPRAVGMAKSKPLH